MSSLFFFCLDVIPVYAEFLSSGKFFYDGLADPVDTTEEENSKTFQLTDATNLLDVDTTFVLRFIFTSDPEVNGTFTITCQVADGISFDTEIFINTPKENGFTTITELISVENNALPVGGQGAILAEVTIPSKT